MKPFIFGSLLACLVLVQLPAYSQYGMIYNVAGFGTGSGAFGIGDGEIADSAVFYQVSSICMDTAHNIYIADKGHYRIRKINAITNIITTIAGTGTDGYSGDGGLAPLAQIGNVSSICTDKAGNVYINDVENYRIRKINMTTGYITTFAGNGINAFAGD